MSALPDSPTRSFLLLLCLSGAVYLSALGASGIHRAQEARVAEVAREMRTTGEWVVPHLNDRVRLNKPPLLYWAVLGAYAALDDVSEFAARLPVALAAIGAVFLAAALAARLYGRRAGLLAGGVLATTQLFVTQGRRAEGDVPMTLFILLSLYAFERGFRGGRRAWKPVFFAAMGVAFMVKGVPGVVVPLLAALIWLAWEGRFREALRPSFLAGLLLTALIIAPWYAIIWFGFPESVEVFRAETLARLGQNAPHGEPVYYYLLRTPVHLLPWILFLPVLWKALRSDGGARTASRLPVAWLAGGLCFLTLLEGKQPHYLVPLVPAFAVLAGGGLDRALTLGGRKWLTERGLALFTGVAVLVVVLFAALIEPRAFARKSPREVCGRVAAEAGSVPLILYRFNNSACVFYLRRTTAVADGPGDLARMLEAAPDAWVLLRVRDASTLTLPRHRVQWESENYKRSLVLLAPGEGALD